MTADDLAELAHQVLVTEHLGPGHVERAAARLLDARHPDQVLEQVVQRDGRRSRPDPAGSDHDGQVVDEVADDLEGRGTGPDDAGPNFGDGHTRFPQHGPGVGTGNQVLRLRVLGQEPPQVDDAADAGSPGGLSEVPCGLPVEFREPAARGHGVHEVVGDVHSREDVGERLRLQRVAAHEFRALPASPLEYRGIAGRRPDGQALPEQPRHEVAADVAAGAEDQVQPGRRFRNGSLRHFR